MIKKYIQLLKRPYLAHPSPWFGVQQALFFAAFLFLFLYVFEPFGLGLIGDRLPGIAFGFAAITLFAMLFLNVLIPQLFTRYFSEQKWTVGREISHSLLNIWLIGLLNFFYFSYAFDEPFALSHLVWFHFISLAVGLIPVSMLTLFRESKHRRFYTENSNELSRKLEIQHQSDSKSAEIIHIQSQSLEEDIQIMSGQLLYLKAADNYVEVYSGGEEINRNLVRNSLKEIENDLIHHSNIFRCHKSYIVNLDQVVRISGNAQGYKLHLTHTDDVIPVSRQYNTTIKQLVSRKTV